MTAGTTDPDEFELPSHSFVVRVWTEQAGHRARWRGHITHVLGGEDRYFQELEAIPDFIRPFLVSMGVRVRSASLAGRWRRIFDLARGRDV